MPSMGSSGPAISVRPSAAAHCHPARTTTLAYGRLRTWPSLRMPPLNTIPTTVSPVSGCGSTPAFTTDEAIVPSSRSVDTTTSPWSPAISRRNSSMSAMRTIQPQRAGPAESSTVLNRARLAPTSFTSIKRPFHSTSTSDRQHARVTRIRQGRLSMRSEDGPRGFTRRRVLGTAAGVAGLSLLPRSMQKALAAPAEPLRSLEQIKHVLILMQENRSFDHYFGTLQGVRGFDDPDPLTLSTGRSVFYQPDPQN